MLRVVVTIVLPLLLPTVLYLGWMWIVRSSFGAETGAESWAALPWIWLAGAGAALLAVVLFVVTIGFGAAERGLYVPPRWINGHIEPGHIEPGRSP
jgi:hypothetical protein